METPEEIEKLSTERLQEAQILFDNKKFDGAFYLSGYSIELALKAKIARRLGVPNLFTNDEKALKSIDGVGSIRNVIKTHNLFTLLIFSGLKEKFDIDKAKKENVSLSLSNSLFFQKWSEQWRYMPCGSMGGTECKKLLELLLDSKGILKWIRIN